MNIEQHQTLARDVSPSTPRINGLYSVCQAADVKWVGKRGNQIGFVVRLICIFDIAPDDRTENGEKSASAAARRRVIEIESSLTQIRRRARFGAEIGFLTALEESASLPLFGWQAADKVPNGQKSTFFTGMGQFGSNLEELPARSSRLARALEKLLVSAPQGTKYGEHVREGQRGDKVSWSVVV